MTDAFTELGSAFQDANPGTTVEFNFGASSSLREQILAGAPADVFASANTSNMDQVVEADMATDPQIFVTNVLEIAVPAGHEAVQPLVGPVGEPGDAVVHPQRAAAVLVDGGPHVPRRR